jgi:hypothetical protein
MAHAGIPPASPKDRSAPGGVAFAPGAGPLMLIGDRWEVGSGDELIVTYHFKFHCAIY